MTTRRVAHADLRACVDGVLIAVRDGGYGISVQMLGQAPPAQDALVALDVLSLSMGPTDTMPGQTASEQLPVTLQLGLYTSDRAQATDLGAHDLALDAVRDELDGVEITRGACLLRLDGCACQEMPLDPDDEGGGGHALPRMSQITVTGTAHAEETT